MHGKWKEEQEARMKQQHTLYEKIDEAQRLRMEGLEAATNIRSAPRPLSGCHTCRFKGLEAATNTWSAPSLPSGCHTRILFVTLVLVKVPIAACRGVLGLPKRVQAADD